MLYLFCGKRILLDNSCALHKYFALIKETNELSLNYSFFFFRLSFKKPPTLNTKYNFLMANQFLLVPFQIAIPHALKMDVVVVYVG